MTEPSVLKQVLSMSGFVLGVCTELGQAGGPLKASH